MNAELAASKSNAEILIGQSTLEWAHMGQKTTVLHCALPNGYETVVTSSCVDPSDYDEQVGQEMCMEKLTDKVIDLLAIYQHGEL